MRRFDPRFSLERAVFPSDEQFQNYLASCADYLRRRMLIYQNWPQRKYGAMGYSEEKVFADMNA